MMDEISKSKWRHDQYLIQLTDFSLASAPTIGQPGTDTGPVFI